MAGWCWESTPFPPNRLLCHRTTGFCELGHPLPQISISHVKNNSTRGKRIARTVCVSYTLQPLIDEQRNIQEEKISPEVSGGDRRKGDVRAVRTVRKLQVKISGGQRKSLLYLSSLGMALQTTFTELLRSNPGTSLPSPCAPRVETN